MLGFPRVGPGWPDAAAAGGASWSLPPPSRAVGPVVPIHFRAAGKGDRAASLSSLFSSHLSSGQKLQRRSAEGSAPKPEPVRGPGLGWWRGLEFWNLAPGGAEDSRPLVRPEGDQEPRLLDPSVRRQGARSLAQWGRS